MVRNSRRGFHRLFTQVAHLLPRQVLRLPLNRAGNALHKLGFVEAAACFWSYLKAVTFPIANPGNFEEWVTDRFGQRMFPIFFKSYTEKVWGMPCSEISADWAAQRIKGISLWSAIRNSISFGNAGEREVIKTLTDVFHYPRKGPGMMWESAGRKIKSSGGSIEMDRRVVQLRRLDQRTWEIVSRTEQGSKTHHKADFVISSMPFRELVDSIEPTLPSEVIAAAKGLKYRDFLIIGLIAEDRNLFDDQWRYIHDPRVKVARIQNFKSWSPDDGPEFPQSLLM